MRGGRGAFRRGRTSDRAELAEVAAVELEMLGVLLSVSEPRALARGPCRAGGTPARTRACTPCTRAPKHAPARTRACTPRTRAHVHARHARARQIPLPRAHVHARAHKHTSPRANKQTSTHARGAQALCGGADPATLDGSDGSPPDASRGACFKTYSPPVTSAPRLGPPSVTSAPGLGPPLPTSAPGPGPPRPHLRRDLQVPHQASAAAAQAGAAGGVGAGALWHPPGRVRPRAGLTPSGIGGGTWAHPVGRLSAGQSGPRRADRGDLGQGVARARGRAG